MESIEIREEVLDFLKTGSGDGSGFGFGSGFGSGSGSGDGSGFGFGSGSGSGDGSGFGSGSGSGDGSGSGSGDGSGFGSGSGIVAVNNQVVHYIDGIPTLIDYVHFTYAKGRILKSNLTTEECFVAKCGNFFAHGETLHQAINDAAEKYEQSLPVEDRVRIFNEQYPDHNKKIKASELFNWHHILTGSCLQGRVNFCKERGLDYENGEYTVDEFIDLTKDSYGGEVIKMIKNGNIQKDYYEKD